MAQIYRTVEELPQNVGDKRTENVNFTFDGEIDNLDFTFGVGNVTIREGESYAFAAMDVPVGSVDADFSGGKFFIKQRSGIFGDGIFGVNWGFRRRMPRLDITLPRGAAFRDVYMKFGVGSVNVTGLSAEKIVVSSGVGENNFDSVRLKNLRFVCGQGRVSFHRSEVENANISGGVGSFDFDGSLVGEKTIRAGVGTIGIRGSFTGKSVVSGGVGSITLDLDGNPADYDFIAEKGVGPLTFNGRGNAFPMNSNSQNKVRLVGGVGNIDVRMQ